MERGDVGARVGSLYSYMVKKMNGEDQGDAHSEKAISPVQSIHTATS